MFYYPFQSSNIGVKAKRIKMHLVIHVTDNNSTVHIPTQIQSTRKNCLERSCPCSRNKNHSSILAQTELTLGVRVRALLQWYKENVHQRLMVILSSLQILFTVTGIAGVRRPLAATSALTPLRVPTAAVAGCRGGTPAPAASSVRAFVLASAALLPAASARVLLLVIAVVVVASEDLVSYFSGPLLAALAATPTRLLPALPSVLILLFPPSPIFIFPLRFTAGVFCFAATPLLFIITWKAKRNVTGAPWNFRFTGIMKKIKEGNESNQIPGHLYPCPYLPLRLLARGSPAELYELPKRHKRSKTVTKVQCASI